MIDLKHMQDISNFLWSKVNEVNNSMDAKVVLLEVIEKIRDLEEHAENDRDKDFLDGLVAHYENRINEL